MSSLFAYEAEERDYDAPEQPERQQVSSALADVAEKEEGGRSGAPVLAVKAAECPHPPQLRLFQRVVVLLLRLVSKERRQPQPLHLLCRRLAVQLPEAGGNTDSVLL